MLSDAAHALAEFKHLVTVLFITTSISLVASTVVITLGGLYFRSKRGRDDPMALRAMVALIILGNISNPALLLTSTYKVVLHNIASAVVDPAYPDELMAANCIGICTVMLAQSFYVNRCYRVSQSKAILAVGALLTLAAFLTGLTQFSYLVVGARDIETRQRNEVSVVIYLWISVVAEGFLVSTFCFYVAKQRKGFNVATDAMLSRLILIAFESSGATLAISVCGAALYSANPASKTWLIFYASVEPSYSLALLYCLLSRNSVQEHGETIAALAGKSTRFPVPVARGGIVAIGCTPTLSSSRVWASEHQHSIVNIETVTSQHCASSDEEEGGRSRKEQIRTLHN